ncbi:Nif3-like dinuclear metal center hexameric protein [Paramaledivibacter caminithermalis]|jgi:dinuclear metal center YbgI/SA1388 family protein|uniref:GTP cyclohydrolase 1 type 2 homolog n=1 Tax=Paramaledivibacter caminithermalis (strain DSM 15212 / CIP 107654 / DViRD3) TaxID=1121301 RepID=A0A1M6M8A8_PARC5|nr:Nif3-like dinuclear metal center hexameric protein [Paramaledivibacter caminithermalis]SHJ79674.1 dinuclear metal center protein, YbgI/SA1388 family [Paramaledivibacter caminithermalis DSM 15212]
MSVECRNIINIMENIAPAFLAEEWDNVGLQVGNPNRAVKRIMICLELNGKTMDEAVEKDIDMIITHHPLIFKPLRKLVTLDPIVRIVNKLIKNDINLYCAHTNLDIAIGGTSDYLAQLLNLKDVSPLSITHNKKYSKLVVFVPEDSIEDVREAISQAGAGNIGNYSHCTFQTKGIGTFKPLDGAVPYIGNINELEKVNECRLESIVAVDTINDVIKAMLKVHPYEEVAYDIIPLDNRIESLGLGRIGYLENPKKLKQLALELKNVLNADQIKMIGDESMVIEKIAICTGSGSEFIKDAYKNKCDCYITGDIKYHDAQFAKELGLNVIDAGHYETENIICSSLKERLITELEKNNYKLEVIISELNINPFKII